MMLSTVSFGKFGATLAVLALGAAGAAGQVLDEDFSGVAGNGTTFFSGSGFGQTFDWDAALAGENAFAGTAGYAHIGGALARGLATGGVGGSGGGLIQINGVTYNLIDQNFNAVTGVGGGAFLVGNGQPDTNGFTAGWDTGITGEQAFGGTFGGAILVGNMTAAGLTTGGVSGTGRGQLRVNNVSNFGGNWYAGMQWPIGSLPGAVPVQNPSFESGLSGWVEYSEGWNIDAVTATGGPPAIIPRTGNTLCKMFGRFWGTYNASGVYQQLPAQPGQVWQIDGYARSNSDDSIAGTQNFMQMRIEFVDGGGAVLLSDQTTIFDGSSPLDVWVDPAPLSLTAPAGTVGMRAVFEFVQPGEGLWEGGAIHLDDVSARLVGGPGGVDLSTITLEAAVRGTANAGAGETLGGVQLRIEDANGNRLLFNSAANGSYQTLGGTLSTAIEADATGTPATGVFDRNSTSYVVVVAFDTASAAWGTGGTLDVDNLRFANQNSTGSVWYGGLYWNALSIPPGAGLDDLELTADIKGETVGGAYQLRLEGYRVGAAGLDEDFDTVTGVGGGTFLSDTDVANGILFGSDSDWDTGITGEGAFGGVFGQAEVFTGGGFAARGLVGGGQTGGGGEISVLDIIVGPGGGWYAGLSWGNQGLASTDLSQVVLTANVRGLAQPGGNLGVYELRIEDAQGDRMYWQATATGDWQMVGGPLSTATEGPRLGGGGDGNFDLDSATYTVALSFIEPETSWLYGGTLQIDNLFLTPVTTRREVGRVTFTGDSDGTFQKVGGLLSEGVTNFGDFSQDFSSVTGIGGAINGPWDTGLQNEGSFYGTYGGASGGTAIARGCLTCGVGGGPGAQIDVDGVNPAGGGFWVGVTFTNVPADLSGDPSQLFLTGKFRGTADANAGEILGTYLFRVEDADNTSLQFETLANGSYQNVGGALSTATLVQIDQGDGVFNYNQGSYTVTIAFVSTATAWGTGGTLDIDDLFLTGVGLDDANEFVVAIAFDDEVATWGNAGSIVVDNVYLGPPTACPGDLNGDFQVNLSDLSQLLSNYGTPTGATFEQGDLNGDGAVSLNDLALLLSVFGSMCG